MKHSWTYYERGVKIIIDETDNGYSAYAPKVLGVVAASVSLMQTLILMREALRMHLEADK